VDGVLGHDAGIFEDDRADGGFPSPVGELLLRAARGAEGIERGGPARVGLGAAVQRGEPVDRAAVLVAGLLEGFGAQELQGAREGFAEGTGLEPNPVAGGFEQALALLDLGLEFLLAVA